jgi:ribulose-phosphate 3-epimerase
MIEIIPGIMPETVADIRNQVAAVLGKTRLVQIDMVDGVFAPTATWPYNGEDLNFIEALEAEKEGMPYWQDMNFELDLMVKNAHDHLDYFYKFAPARIVLHAEAEGDEEEFANFIEAIDPYIRDNTEIGVAFNVDSDIDAYRHIIKEVDFVQCMGIAEIGKQGQDFDERVYSQIKKVADAFPGLPIAVDGGVNLDNIENLIAVGATRLVVGSALWKSSSPLDTLREMKAIAHAASNSGEEVENTNE